MKRLFHAVTLLVCATALSQTHGLVNAERTRFYKAECGTAANYLELAKDGTYRVIDREHMGVSITEQGHWQQDGSMITFRPSTVMRGGKMVSTEDSSYGGTEIEYKGRTFIAFNAEGAAGIVIPVDETKKQLDGDPQSIPLYVFFKTTAKVYARETKQPYPFRYLESDK
jgi:hypothetical protein